MKICYGFLLFITLGCATSGLKTIRDVRVGDKLTMTEEEFSDCTMVVDNIATVQGTPVGLVPVPPIVCGILTCEKSLPEALLGMPACLELKYFLPVVKKTK